MASIVNAVIDTGKWVYSVFSSGVVKAVQTTYDIIRTLEPIYKRLYGVTVASTVAVLQGIGVISGKSAENALKEIGVLDGFIGTLYQTVESKISTLDSLFKKVLETIHFKTLLRVHNVLEITSNDYREMQLKIYKSFSNFSKAIGEDAQFMNLILRNTRSIVLDTSTSLGASYDIAEMAWLTQLTEFTSVASKQANLYAYDPYYLLRDLEKHIEKPALDLKGKFIHAQTTALAESIEGLAQVAIDANKIKQSLLAFQFGFTDSFRKHVDKFVQPLIDALDFVQIPHYLKKIQDINNKFDAYNKGIFNIKNELIDVTKRLASPANYLHEIDKLTENERINQEDSIAEISNRTYQREKMQDVQDIETYEKTLQAITKALEQQYEIPAWSIPSVTAPEKLDTGEIKVVLTWQLEEDY